MSAKILLADDSLTIQKVIKITLANEPFEIIDCKNESDLFKIIKKSPVDLILLDFGLSEEANGYELAKRIKGMAPQSKILMMYGTFDTIDDNTLKKCGVDDKIVKPFDSSKFISLCHELIENNFSHAVPTGQTGSSPDYSNDENDEDEMDIFDLKSSDESEKSTGQNSGEKEQDLVVNFKSQDEWVVNSSAYEEEDLSNDFSQEVTKTDFNINLLNEFNKANAAKSDHQTNPLLDEVREWDMEIPPSKDDHGKMGQGPFELPPIMNVMPKGNSRTPDFINTSERTEVFEIGALSEPQSPQSEIQDESIFPSNNDLEYPAEIIQKSGHSIPIAQIDQNGLFGQQAQQGKSEKEERRSAKPQFASLDDLHSEHENSEKLKVDFEATDPHYTLNLEGNHQNSTRNIEMQIDDEISADKFWSVDKSASKPVDIKEAVPKFDLNANKTLSQHELNAQVQKITDTLISQFGQGVSEKLRPMVEECLKEYCKSTIERIAWEILPDLAENLVRKELNNIVDQVKKDS